VDTLRLDVRYALRSLARSPGFVAAVVLTLALGIGANTAIFSVVEGVLLRPLPYPHPERLVRIYENDRNEGRERGSISPADFVDYRERQRTLSGLGAFTFGDLQWKGETGPERLRATMVSAGFFDAVGVAPAIGRTFAADADAPGVERGVVLSHGLWVRAFGGDASVVGRRILLSDAAYTVIGVMPEGFVPPSGPADLWAPIDLERILGDPFRARKFHFVNLVGRMKPDASLEGARADFAALARALEAEYPEANTGHMAVVFPLQEAVTGDLRPALLTLLGGVGFVLLIACANVANLSLSRAVSRQRELSVRAALGAGRGRLLRHLLTESLALAAVGGVLGVVLAAWGIPALLALAPVAIPIPERVGINTTVLGFALAASAAAGLAFGLVPGLAMLHRDLLPALQQGERTTGGSRQRLRSSMVSAQAALAVVLLAGAALCVRSVSALGRVALGYQTESILTFATSLSESRYASAESRAAFYTTFLERLRAIPGAEAAAVVGAPPLGGSSTASLFIEGRPAPKNAPTEVIYQPASEDYFQALRIPVVAGRVFTAADRGGAPGVVLVSRSAALRFWPGESPIGAHVRLGPDPTEPWSEVVGVVGDVRQESVAGPATPVAYIPIRQDPWENVSFVLRSRVDPAVLERDARAAAATVDPAQPLYLFRPLDALVASDLARPRFSMLLLTAFAGLALVLAGLGVYAVAAFAVAQRSRELGVRFALGAAPRDVVGLVLRQGLAAAVPGAAIGMVAALALCRLLSGLLYGVSPFDPPSMLFAPAVLLAAALTASYLPARRAARMDPLRVLRAE
jgi:putative ABC transport system permease protein